jgi:hypothetical protein
MEATNSTEEKSIHPEGKILLINGNLIDGYEKEDQKENTVDNELRLDTTGKYFQISRKPITKPIEIDKEKEKIETDMFIKNAWLFYKNREKILNDSRMFLSPVPIRNILAYSGESGFRKPTIGIYIEWWINCESSIIQDENAKTELVYYIAGSPLTGTNSCSAVNESGKFPPGVHHSFYTTLGLQFMKDKTSVMMNARNDIQHNSMQEVIGHSEKTMTK